MKQPDVTQLSRPPVAWRMANLRRLALIVMAGVLLALASYASLAAQSTGLQTQDMTTGLTAESLAESLVGSGGGVTVSNAVFTGSNVAAGKFSGGDGIIGFDSGIILSTGNIAGVVGPNNATSHATSHGQGGDAALTALATLEGQTGATQDAAVLTFDFVPDGDNVFFDFVFASEEYPEYVHSDYNDVFAFYVNGTNCALVNGQPVSINTINNANPEPNRVTRPPNVAVNPELYLDNKAAADGSSPYNTQMDGLTRVLNCAAPVNRGVTNTLKLAIADTGDSSYDSTVFIKAGSLTTIAPTVTPTTIAPTPTVTPTPTPATSATVGSNHHGDVHISSPDGLVYDFQEVGDYILTQSTSGDVKVHARQEAWPTNANVSVNTAVAMWVAGDTVVFDVKNDTFTINGELTPLPTSTLALPAGGRIELTFPDRTTDFTIYWPDGSTGARAILISTAVLDNVNIGVGRLGGSLTYEGVLGNLDGNAQNDMQIRGGELLTPPATLAQLKSFGDSWRVPAGESLFDTPHPADPAAAAPEPLSLVDLEPAARVEANQRCLVGGVSNPIALEDCTYDVAVTGEEGFVTSALAHQEAVEQLPAEQQNEPVVGVQGQTLEIGQQYAVADVPGTFRYFVLLELPGRPGAQALLALCPEQEIQGNVNVEDILSPAAAMAQGLTASNEPCMPVDVDEATGTTDEVAPETVEEAVETDVTPEAVAEEDAATTEPAEETADTAAPAEEDAATAAPAEERADTAAPAESGGGGISGICSAPAMMSLFIGFGMVFMKVSRRRR